MRKKQNTRDSDDDIDDNSNEEDTIPIASIDACCSMGSEDGRRYQAPTKLCFKKSRIAVIRGTFKPTFLWVPWVVTQQVSAFYA